MNATTKDSELPAPDSCAIMEGEDAEDDLIFTSKKSLFGKIKSFTTKVRVCSFPVTAGWWLQPMLLTYIRHLVFEFTFSDSSTLWKMSLF